MKPTYLFALPALLAALGTLFWLAQSPRPGEQARSTSGATAPGSAATTAAPSAPAKPLKAPPGVSPTFAGFLEREAAALDAPTGNQEEAQERVAAAAAAMSAEDIRFAQSLALDSEGAANQRILATYLLMHGGEKSRAALWEIARAGSPSAGRAEPHSIDELKAAQARALQLMALDALADAAERDAAAREELLRRGSELRDETLRKHVQRRLQRMPAL